MARPSSREPGWLTSLLGAVVLIAGGFLVGLVFGVVSEEPDLVVEHIAGGSEEVAWDAEATPPSAAGAVETPDVAAAPRDAVGGEMSEVMGSGSPVEEVPSSARVEATAPSASAVPQRAVPPPPTASPPPPKVDRVAARPSADRFAVQVGAFSDSASAERLASDLESQGFPTYVTASAGAGRWRVRVGPVPSRKEADALAGRLEDEKGLPTWILSEEAD
jgi:DedD protein